MRKLLIGSIIALVVAFAAYRWYQTENRARLIDTEIENLAIRDNPLKLREAAHMLGQMGPDAKTAIPALIEVLMLNDTSQPYPMQIMGNVKGSIAEALVAIGPASVEPLLNAIRDPKNRERGWGILPPQHYLHMPPLFIALGQMRTQLGSSFDSSEIDQTLNDLMTNHDSQDVRLWAGQTIGMIELKEGERIPYPPSPPWDSEREKVAYWTRNLEHEDPYARAWATHILGEKAMVLRFKVVDSMEALPAVAAGLEDPVGLVREESSRSLQVLVQQAKGKARDVMPALMSAIQQIGEKPAAPGGQYERRLFWCLDDIGMEAHAAVPLLLKILQDNQNEFRPEAATALGWIGDAEAIPALINALDETDNPTLVAFSAKALGRYGSNAKQAVPELLKLLDDDRVYSIGVSLAEKFSEGTPITVRETVAKALTSIEPK